MGYWETDKRLILGDGPLDLAYDCLNEISKDYLDEIGRKPTIEEIIETFIIHLRESHEQFCGDSVRHAIKDIKIVFGKRNAKRKMKVGDIVSIPLGDGTFGFAQVTANEFFPDYFRVRSSNPIVPIRVLSSASRFHVKYLVDSDIIEKGEWKVIYSKPDMRSDSDVLVSKNGLGFPPTEWILKALMVELKNIPLS